MLIGGKYLAQRFTIILVSSLEAEKVAAMGMRPASSLAEAMTTAEELLAPGWRVMVMPEGGSVLPVTIPES